MSAPAAPATPAASAPSAGAPAEGEQQTLLSNVQIAAFVVLVVTLECGAAFFFLPSPHDVAAMAADQVKKQEAVEKKADSHHGDGAHGEDAHGEAGHTVEVDLGKFAITSTQPASNAMLRISFSLWGAVEEKELEEFQELYERNMHRLRQEVIFIVRQTDVDGLTDPNLVLLKRRIQDKANFILGKTVLRGVVFSEFSFIDQ